MRLLVVLWSIDTVGPRVVGLDVTSNTVSRAIGEVIGHEYD